VLCHAFSEGGRERAKEPLASRRLPCSVMPSNSERDKSTSAAPGIFLIPSRSSSNEMAPLPSVSCQLTASGTRESSWGSPRGDPHEICIAEQEGQGADEDES